MGVDVNVNVEAVDNDDNNAAHAKKLPADPGVASLKNKIPQVILSSGTETSSNEEDMQ